MHAELKTLRNSEDKVHSAKHYKPQLESSTTDVPMTSQSRLSYSPQPVIMEKYLSVCVAEADTPPPLPPLPYACPQIIYI